MVRQVLFRERRHDAVAVVLAPLLADRPDPRLELEGVAVVLHDVAELAARPHRAPRVLVHHHPALVDRHPRMPGEVAVAVEDFTKKLMRDVTVENLFNLAASQGFGAGVSQAQLETRMRMQKQMSKKLGEEFKGIEVSNSKKYWTSCFYLVLK